MKSPEQQLHEWVTDEIVFDGEGLVGIFSREEFSRLASALGQQDGDMILKFRRKPEPYDPLAVTDDICLPPGSRVLLGDGGVSEMCLSVDRVVDWRLARNFFKNRGGPREISAQWLLQFSNLLEAIFAVGNLPEAILEDTHASF